MARGSTERLPRETPAPEDYYELTNSQPPATCVGCQAWSKAQGSGSCPVGVRRFKSCPTHPSRVQLDVRKWAFHWNPDRTRGRTFLYSDYLNLKWAGGDRRTIVGHGVYLGAKLS